ncbi:MAG: hypothetical protein JW819_02290 [Candidatus Krumholzibacteriota bacterium]|nr:hypothetical protein [Candidatus Krumholzibacteriota bacterium]
MLRRLAVLSLLLLATAGSFGAARGAVRPEPPTTAADSLAAARAARFGERVTRGLVQLRDIDEASGLAASRQNPGVLWTLNDSGDEPRLFALDTTGRHLGVYHLLGADARDWEDLAVGPGPLPGRQYIYVGEIGDNRARHETKVVYRVPEPVVRADQAPIETWIGGVEALRFRYPDGRRDAEALMADPLTGDLYIISKREAQARIYRAPCPQAPDSLLTLTFAGTLPFNLVTAADCSADGGEVLVKTYGHIRYWVRGPGESLAETLARPGRMVPYRQEPQGESVAWAPDGSGYYTLSEEKDGVPAFLYFYPRSEE